MSEPDSNLTPAQDDAVRKLLAAARHTEPIPPDIVARLDTTLASLTSERLEVRAPVVTLASRRRRTAATALLAAAAVVVFGVGIGQVLPSMNTAGDDSAGSTAESSATSDEDEDQLSTAESGEAYDAESDSSAGADKKQGETLMRSQESPSAPTPGALEDLSGLTSDAELKPRVRALRPAAPLTSSFSAGPDCLVEAAAPGDHVSITYDGQPGVLVYRAPAAGRQRVDVYVCGEPGPTRSVRLRAH